MGRIQVSGVGGMGAFVTMVSGFRPLTIVAEVLVLYCAGVLGPPRGWIQCVGVVWGGDICGDGWRLAAVDCCRGGLYLMRCGGPGYDYIYYVILSTLYCYLSHNCPLILWFIVL